ncbi:Fe(3+)-siderophore ABC transporter permease [Xenorhabdus bovienii]|uniref:Fe(3+)-siderophore ABC transporter permease n=1 Tax=Xenorhabdus bovienii TaxID=40576 RepID=A0AAJ1MZT3_XENBV|nr:Fe(3+)-siderophore ABC transporter permease [Xenorhabdus bovienii]MDE9509024.1 Fe(3+)-siderophore ABC transporter permease [Xenorhabdus bovienii]MDE9520777.1 Fe(3+)-siderophore ABC transporter permease [Xenorhabdus bovienii]
MPAAPMHREITSSKPLPQFHTYRTRRLTGPIICLLLLIIFSIASLLLGSKYIAPETVWNSLTGELHNNESIIILESRLPRTLVGILVGMALGGAGALIQALTRNPLADPGILGVNAGASFAIVVAITLFGLSSVMAKVSVACLGAFLASLAVWLISMQSGDKSNPVRLTLSGVAISALLTGVTTNIALLNPSTFDQLRIWQAGTLDIRSLQVTLLVAPLILIGCALTLLISRPLNTLSMGEEIATTLGVKILWVKVSAIIAIMLLCGTATALAGPIGFVGLMIPHIARWWCGPDQCWIILHSLLMAPVLLLSADIVGRLLVAGELRVSIVTAFIGAPVLIWQVRKRKY